MGWAMSEFLAAIKSKLPKADLLGSGDAAEAELKSPTGDQRRTMRFWLDDGEPSFAFGDWHTHQEMWRFEGGEELVDLALAVVADVVLLIEDLDGEYAGFRNPLDLRAAVKAAEVLRSPWHTRQRVAVLSWSGAKDFSGSWRDAATFLGLSADLFEGDRAGPDEPR